MAFAMLEMSRKAPVIERNLKRLLKDTAKEKILTKLSVAFEKGTVSKSEIESLLEGLEPASLPSTETRTLLFSPEWEVVRRDDHLVFLSDGQRFGYTSDHPDRGLEFWCPTCGNEGPWNGVICMSCGHKSAPGY
jgi:hypothetical protein